MLLFQLAYAGGVLTILSPCILPVLPFVFARSDQPLVRSGLPLLLGMAFTFAGVATLAAVGGGWAVQPNAWGRDAALVLLALFGLALLFPHLSDASTRPLVALGSRLSESASDSSRHTAGAATSLGVALLIGGRVFGAMKRSPGASEWIRRALGVALLCGVTSIALALGLATGLLSRLSLTNTAIVEHSLLVDYPVAVDNDSDQPHAKIAYRFHARDLHLVPGPRADGEPVRFRVTVDGKPPLADHGMDVDEQGIGGVTSQRLYQLARQQGAVADRLFEIEFLDPGVQAFAFTFG